MERIDITGVDLEKFVKKVYELSSPQGLGFLQYTEGPLDMETVTDIINAGDKDRPISMDYVRGRSCKMTVRRESGRLCISDSWFDHTDRQLRELLQDCGIKHIVGKVKEGVKEKLHSVACNCIDCQLNRKLGGKTN